MNEQPILVSVIVAVYNVENYIYRCLDSLKQQTLQDYEVILVDDGSTDSSGTICDQIAKEDSRFKVLHKTNGGVSSAREAGVRLVRGAYMIHVDPDDWIDNDMLDSLYTKAIETGADVVICDFYEEVGNTSILLRQFPRSTQAADIILQYLDGTLHGSCWNKLVKTITWRNNNVHFPWTNLCEDTFVCVSMALNHPRYAYLPHAFYHYRREENINSITSIRDVRAGVNAYTACREFRKLLGESIYWPYFVKHEMPWIAYICLYYDAIPSTLFKKEFSELKHLESIDGKVRIALKNYSVGLFLIRLRRTISYIIHLWKK